MRVFDLWRWRQFQTRDWRGKICSVVERLTGYRLPTISVSIMPSCPLHCKCCPWETYQAACASQGMMDALCLEDFKAILWHIPKYVLIEFCGASESLMSSETPDMILWAWQEGYRVQLFTTLVGLTEDGAKKLRGIKFEKLLIHPPDMENFTFNEDRWLGYLQRFDLAEHPFPIFGPLGSVSDKIREACSSRGYITDMPLQDKRPLSDHGKLNRLGPLKCATYCRGRNVTMLWPNGDLSYCCFDYQHESVIGNLGTQMYRQIIHGAARREYERKQRSESEECLCRHCEESRPA